MHTITPDEVNIKTLPVTKLTLKCEGRFKVINKWCKREIYMIKCISDIEESY